MSEKVNLANAIVDRMLHPDSDFRKNSDAWRIQLDTVCLQGIEAANAVRGDSDALGIAAAAMRLCAAGQLNVASDVAKILREAVNKAEEFSKA